MIKRISPILQNQYLLLFGVLVFFLTYLLLTINRQGFWHDEIYTLSFIKGFDIYLFEGSDLNVVDHHSAFWYKEMLGREAFWTNLYRNLIHEGHPPLYYLLLKLWSYPFGANEFGLRSFSVFTACLSLFFSFKIGKLVAAKAAILFPLLLATCPLFIYYGIEARSYSLYILFALLCFYHFLRIIKTYKSDGIKLNSYFIGFLVSATLLFYTHYYGVFFYGILALVISIPLIKKREFLSISLLTLPGIVFLPWLSFIRKQTAAHNVHWTDGYLGFLDSIQHFSVGTITLITAPSKGEAFLEIWLPLMILLVLLINYLAQRQSAWQNILVVLLLSFAFGLSIIAFDKVLDHHTIAVPRYYIPLQFVFLFFIFYLIVNGKSKWISITMTGALLFVFLMIQSDFYSGNREPKQMYREAAGYLSQMYNPENVELVISPNGPSAVAIAYYLSEDFIIHSLPANVICPQYKKEDKVIVEQRLGLADEPWMQPCKTNTLNSRIVRFVGLDVINKK